MIDISRCVGLFAILCMIVGCGGGGKTGDDAVVNDVPDVSPESGDAAPEAVDDVPSDPGLPDPGGPDSATDAILDPSVDVSGTICCIYDFECPDGMECVPIPGELGVCKPIPVEGDCWTGSDCGPDQVCLGAIPCRCGQDTEGDGCDIPGQCVDESPGCCDADPDCPAHQVCTPGGTCESEPDFGECWTDIDCYETQECTGASYCICGDSCDEDGVHPGACSPLPNGCCNSDEDCDDGFVCRRRGLFDHMPGHCLPSPLGPQCPGDFACCWEDVDCPGGFCDGAYACGCIDLCYTCGACAEDQMGACEDWGIQVDLDITGGECGGTPEVHPAFTWYGVSLSWQTSIPAKSQVETALNAFIGMEGWIPIDEDYVLDHMFDLHFSHMHFPAVPKVGDAILVRVRATGEGEEKGLSEVLEIQVDQTMRDCLYPYYKACSDGGPILCRAIPPPCDPDKVMAAFDGCQRCVYPGTCTCDDGTEPVCPMPQPDCDDHEVLAVQGGCFACVSPFTCNEGS